MERIAIRRVKHRVSAELFRRESRYALYHEKWWWEKSIHLFIADHG
jgi:hypothetical protein